MKIAIATGIFPPDVGGPATFVPMIASAWVKRGWSVAVVTYSDKEDSVERPYELRRISREFPLPMRYAHYVFELWKASRGAATIFAQDGVASGFPAWLIARLRRKRFVLKVVGDFAWEHARVQEDYLETIETFQKDAFVSKRIKFMSRVQRFVARHADAVIVPSRYLGDLVESWGVNPARVSVVYNGVDVPEVKRQTSNVKRIVSAGRLVPWKGFDTLIEAMKDVVKRVPDATLTIVGDGPREEVLRTKAKLSGVGESIAFAGRLPQKGLWKLISESGVFALVSSYEGFSHQLVEAVHCGTPIVASRAGGNPELVKDGETGLLVPFGDVKATADALVRMLEDRAFAEACAARAKASLPSFSVAAQVLGTTEAVRPGADPRIVIISRDGSLADPDSRGAARMRLYASRVGRVRVLALSKSEAKRTALTEQLDVETIDVRDGLLAPFRIWSAVDRAVADIRPNLVVAQDPFEAGLIGWLVARKAKASLVLEEHGGVFLGPHWKDESTKNRLLHPFGLHLLGHADGIRVVSRKIGEDLRRRFKGTRVTEIPVYTEPLTGHSTAPGHVFGYVGRFVPQKNLPMLLMSFRSVHKTMPEARLIMAGAGPLEDELRLMAAEYQIGDAIEWIPFSQDVASIYSKIGTLVLPSWYEGWGRVVVEALQCGLPVVMTDVGCAGELLRDGQEGLVTPIGDAAAFADAMREAAKPETHAKFAAAAKKRAADVETPDQLADRLTAFWKSCLGL